MSRKAVLSSWRKIATLSLGALPVVLGVMPKPAWPEPTVELLPLTRALSDQTQLVTSARPADPRATAVGTEISEAIRRVRNNAAPSLTTGGAPRRSAADRVAVSSGRKPEPSPTRMADGGGRRAGAAIRITPSEFEVRMRQGGAVRSLQARPTEVLQRAVGDVLADDERTVRTFVSARRPLFGLDDPDRELHLRARQTDRLGHRHLRFEQTFDGVSVYGAELIAQLDGDGNLITMNGGYVPTPRKLVTQPVVNRSQAVDLVRALHPVSSGTSSPEPTLVVFLKDGIRPHLAWRFEWQVGALETRLIMIDAHTGAVLTDFNRVQSANTQGSGIDLFGALHNLNVWEEAGAYHMLDASKPMYDPASTPPQLISSNGVVVVQDAGNLPASSEPQTLPLLASVTAAGADGPWLPDAVSAAANLSATYDYFLEEHGRDSLDAEGGNLVAVVRLGQGFSNALFDSSTQTMYFGDAMPYVAALDVVAHELTHGVIAHSANLLYQGQSGALNEAFADIFAEMVEAKVNGQPDWLLGSSLGSPLRNMANPGAMQFAPGMPFPSRMSEYVATTQDNGGVHINSSIVNHAFYQLAAGLPNAIGIDAAADIFYRALTTKLTPLSNFTDARLAAIQSAEELFGVDSVQAQGTAAAFDAVEIFDTPTNPLPSPFPGSAGTDATLFVYWDGVAGDYYLGRHEPSIGDALPGIQLSLNPVSPAKPSISGDGSFAVFVNAQNDVCLIATDGSSFESCIGFPGSTSSIAMSPDGSTFAIVLLDGVGNPENQISVIDIETEHTRTFKLVSPAYDGVSSIEVIRADALDFTSDGRFIVYDAFNALTFADAPSVGLWSIYAIDLMTDATLVVLPPTIDENGNALDIAYPAIAQTSDGHMTFDVFDSTAGENYVFAGDIYSGALAILGVTSTFATPGYTGDDAGIVYSVTDIGTPTQFSLLRQSLAGDRVTPTGSAQSWLADADYGVVYRRGDYLGPARVDVAVSQSATTEVGHRAVFRIETTNLGPNEATDVQLVSTLPSDVGVSVLQDNGTCEVLVTGRQVACELATLQPGAVEVIEIAVDVRRAGSLMNSITAFASEPDENVSDNTSFSTVEAAMLNAAPIVVMEIGAREAQVGAPFSIGVTGHFEDADDDALSFDAAGLPAGLSIDAQTGAISGTPSSGTDRSAPYVVEVTASDSFGGTAVSSLNLTVKPAPPSAGGPGGSSSGGGGSGALDPFSLFGLLFAASFAAVRVRRILRPCAKLAVVFAASWTLASHAQIPDSTTQSGTLHASVILVGDDLSLKPVPRKNFRIDGLNGASFETLTSFDGKISIDLPTGKYRLNNAEPVELQGVSYSWSMEFTVQAGAVSSLDLSNDNAVISGSVRSQAGLLSETELYDRYRGSVFKVISESGHGSGFLVDAAGLIVTNHHVVGQSDYLAVSVDERRKYPGELVAQDEVNDIAVVRVHPTAVEGRLVLPLLEGGPNSSQIVTGERVLAIGSPLATETILTTGIVSKVETGAVYSDVNINEGNSGGPLFNAHGEVIGINTFGVVSRSGPGVSGIVRIHLAEPVLAQARASLTSPPPRDEMLAVPSLFTFPAAELREEALRTELRSRDYHLEAGKFDVTFIDPVVVASLEVASERAAAETRGRRNRRKTGAAGETVGSDFYEWRKYAGDYRPVVTIQATPELGMPPGSWLAAGLAGVNSGLRLWFKADFGRMELLRNGVAVPPLHPGRIRQVVDENIAGNRLSDIGYYGRYEYPPEAFEPGADLVLRVWQQGTERPVERKLRDSLVGLIWSHFEPYYSAIQALEP